MSNRASKRPQGNRRNNAPGGLNAVTAQIQQLEITNRRPKLTAEQRKEKEEQRKKSAAERKAKLESWSAAEKHLARYKPGSSATSGDIRSNFFKISFLPKGGRFGKKLNPDIADLSQDLVLNENVIFGAKTGFFSSVRPGIGSLLLNVSVTTSAFYPAGVSVQKWIERRYNKNKIPPGGKLEELRGLKVDLLGDHGRSYRIEAVGPFNEYQEFTGQSVANLDPNAACVNIGSVSDPLWRPADKLRFADWQMVTGKLDSEFTAEMVTVASNNPNANLQKIIKCALNPLGIGVSEGGENFLRDQKKAQFKDARAYPMLKAVVVSLGKKDLGNPNNERDKFLSNFAGSLYDYGLATESYWFQSAT
ncbi:hypothetical protein IFR05_011636 [Cadophora sp. M221]|nr:hypothetical protein IFR05_011636 [Cadophora sp. M221]